MAPSVSLSIPHELSASRRKDDLQSQVQQLVLQKGPFRNVTETRLLADSQRPVVEADEDEDEAEHDDGDAPYTVQATRERLSQMRVEYLQMSSYVDV